MLALNEEEGRRTVISCYKNFLLRANVRMGVAELVSYTSTKRKKIQGVSGPYTFPDCFVVLRDLLEITAFITSNKNKVRVATITILTKLLAPYQLNLPVDLFLQLAKYKLSL